MHQIYLIHSGFPAHAGFLIESNIPSKLDNADLSRCRPVTLLITAQRGQRQQLIFALRLDSLDVFAYMLLPNQLRLPARFFDSIAP